MAFHPWTLMMKKDEIIFPKKEKKKV